MDPNAALHELRLLTNRRLRRDEDSDQTNPDHDALRIAELVAALDGWLSSGGFLPDRWSRQTHVALVEGDQVDRDGDTPVPVRREPGTDHAPTLAASGDADKSRRPTSSTPRVLRRQCANIADVSESIDHS
jgi:hypothetical protein